MIWVDWVLLGMLALSTIVGLWRGLVREIMSVLIWIVAIWAALKYSQVAAGYVSSWITPPSMQALVGFAGVLLVTLTVGGLLVWLIGKLVDATGLSGTDRTFGMLFGIGRGVIIIAAAVLVARFTAMPQDPWWQASALLPQFERIADEGVTLLPEDIQELLESDAENTASLVAEDTANAAADQLISADPARPDSAADAAILESTPSGLGTDEITQPPVQNATVDTIDDINDKQH